MSSAFQTISVDSAFRFQLIEPSKEVKKFLFVFHGYGQLVSYFSRKFTNLNLENTLIIFPEGRHRFYLNGTSGRVGASWMTKEWRDDDIQFNNNALNTLHQHLLTHYPTAKTTDLLGFSQGGATAARWATAGVVKCSHFISWASIFPPEVEINGFTQQVDKLSFVIGNDDIYFQGDNYDQALAWYREMNATIVPFSGKHDIDIETLTTLL